MVQLKFSNDSKSKPATDEMSKEDTPKTQSKEEWIKEWRAWYSEANTVHLVCIFLFLWRFLELTGYGPLYNGSMAVVDLLVPKSWESWEPSQNAQTFIAFGFLLLLIVILQLDAYAHVLIYNKSSNVAKILPALSRNDLIFKYVQYCIPQVLLGGLVLLQPDGFNQVIQYGIMGTLVWNTCSTLLVLIEMYIRLLEKKRTFEKKYLTPKKGADEIPAVIVS